MRRTSRCSPLPPFGRHRFLARCPEWLVRYEWPFQAQIPIRSIAVCIARRGGADLEAPSAFGFSGGHMFRRGSNARRRRGHDWPPLRRICKAVLLIRPSGRTRSTNAAPPLADRPCRGPMLPIRPNRPTSTQIRPTLAQLAAPSWTDLVELDRWTRNSLEHCVRHFQVCSA